MTKYKRIITMMFIDALLIMASIYASYLLRFDFHIPVQYATHLPFVYALFVILSLLCFNIFKIYNRIWQYASVGDLLSIFKGTLLASILIFSMNHFIVIELYPNLVVPRSIYVISSVLIFISIGGSRFAWRMYRDNYRKLQSHHRKAMIVGAGEAGVVVVRELKHTKSDIYPVIFIDDDVQKQNQQVLGVPVIGDRTVIPQAVKQYDIEDIIIAMPSATRMEISEIINICKTTGCRIKIIPRVQDLIDGKVSVKMIRDVSVEDLLGREQIQTDIQSISGYLNGKVVMVTGAGGSIGSELCRQISQFDPDKLLLVGHGENSIYEIENELKRLFPELTSIPLIADVQDKTRLEGIFEQYKPHVIFHAAAHKHVPLMEGNPLEAVKNNILGTYHVASCAHKFEAERFVMISTDKAVNPTNVMGASKKAAEMIVQAYQQVSETKFSAVRFGNVLGSRGSVIPLFKEQIEQGGPVTVTHPDMIRYFMTIPEAVQLVIQAGALADEGEIFVLDMGQPVKIADLAHDLIRLSGLEPNKDIMIEYTGVRPGEKLFEELLTKEEGMTGTKHDRIFIGKSSGISLEQMSAMLQAFEQMISMEKTPEPDDVRQELAKWVTTYQIADHSNNSTFEINEALRASLQVVAALEEKNDSIGRRDNES